MLCSQYAVPISYRGFQQSLRANNSLVALHSRWQGAHRVHLCLPSRWRKNPDMATTSSTTDQQIYEAAVVFTLQNTNREVADEFVAARDVRELAPATIEVVLDIVAPTNHDAYRSGVNLVRATLDAADLIDQYSLGDARLEALR